MAMTGGKIRNRSEENELEGESAALSIIET